MIMVVVDGMEVIIEGWFIHILFAEFQVFFNGILIFKELLGIFLFNT